MLKIVVAKSVLIIAVMAGLQTAGQAGPFWGLVVVALAILFGVMALVPILAKR